MTGAGAMGVATDWARDASFIAAWNSLELSGL